jgi:hypothetical protein
MHTSLNTDALADVENRVVIIKYLLKIERIAK